MQIRYFAETDTLFIKLNDRHSVETRELKENLLVDLDNRQRIVGVTIENATAKSRSLNFSYEDPRPAARRRR